MMKNIRLAAVAVLGLLTGNGVTVAQQSLQGLPDKVDAKVLFVAPDFDFDGDACLPAAAIDADGKTNTGEPVEGDIVENCRNGKKFRELANSYARHHCVTDEGSEYCAYVFGLYFVKDQTPGAVHAIAGFFADKAKGHRHDWEHVVIYTKDGEMTHGGVSAHGGLDLKKAKNIPSKGSKRHHKAADFFRVVYHGDGLQTHALRFASTDDASNPENPLGFFTRLNVVQWHKLTQSQREGISQDWGSAMPEIKDNRFFNYVNRYAPTDSGYPVFEIGTWYPSNKNNWYSEETSDPLECPAGQAITGMKCKGSYCDNKRVKCSPFDLVDNDTYWTDFFSEENSTMNCKDGYIAAALECSGSYCDNLKIRCKRLSKAYTNMGRSNRYTFSISDENDPAGTYKGDSYATESSGTGIYGIKCHGRYCDKLELHFQGWKKK